jgi:hypothetical protein
MDSHEKTPWVGKLSLDLLFKDSKSEGFYPVLHCEDGIRYRVYLKGIDSLHKDLLNHFMDQRISLLGHADNLRGHWRLVVDSNDPGYLVEIASEQSETLPSQIKTSEAEGE